MAQDTFETYIPSLVDSARHAAVVTASDTVDLTAVSRALWIGGAGNINVITQGGETVLISGIQAGTLIPIRVSRVLSTNTTATLIVNLY